MIPTEFEAILSLVGGRLSNRVTDGDKIEYTYHDGQTPPSDAEIDAELKRMQDEYNTQEYARKREAEYPSIQECVHAILDDDLTALQEKRQAIKTKYPKS